MSSNKMNFLHLLTTAIFISTVSTKSSLEKYIPLCDVKSPNLNQCVRDSANKLIPHLKDGLREADLPPLDPLKIQRMDVGQEAGTVYLKLELSETVHTGLSRMRIDSAQMNMDKLEWVLNGTLPWYSLTGNYVGKGRILLLPLGGAGLANFTFVDLKTSFVLKGAKKVINGQEHLDVKEAKVSLKFSPGKNYLDIHRLKGDLTLADHTRQFLRENADEVFNGMQVTLEDVYTDIFTGLLRRLFNKIPLKQVFKN